MIGSRRSITLLNPSKKEKKKDPMAVAIACLISLPTPEQHSYSCPSQRGQVRNRSMMIVLFVRVLITGATDRSHTGILT